MSTVDTTTLQPGMILENKWIIIEHIGTGAMGEVYRAHQSNLNRDVAIKIISADIMAEIEEDVEERETAFARFRREVRTMAQVSHPHILTIYDYGEISGDEAPAGIKTAYIVMEYIPGNSLRFTMDEDGLDDEPERYARWIKDHFMPILDGVKILHEHKIVHRDLKPENIFMDGDIPKIADFGLARSYRMKAVTSSLEMLGTLAYMSPEQCSDFKNADFTTDIYALGKILFEAYHGTLTEKTVPFTTVAIEEPHTPFWAGISLIIAKATAESTETRYQSAHQLQDDLQKSLATGTEATTERRPIEHDLKIPASMRLIPATPAGRIGVAIVIVLLSSAALWSTRLFQEQQSVSGLNSATYNDHGALLEAHHVKTITDTQQLAATMIGIDGSRMILTGTTDNSKDTPQFYMDEQKISNFLYVEFLNSLRDEVTVENGIVRLAKTIIIYIDSGSSMENAIVYKHNRFHLNNQEDGPKPVRRVTYHGAHLYAATYSKDLLNDQEWRLAYHYHAEAGQTDDSDIFSSTSPGDSSKMMHDVSPPPRSESSRPTVIDDMGGAMREWVRITQHIENQTVDYNYESGVMSVDRLRKNDPPLKRFPWEGFTDVGFRTKITVLTK